MSTILENYFHYGIKDNQNSYYQYGVSYDNFDLNKMSAPALFYDTIIEFYSDLVFIANLYLFGRLFQTSEYNLITSTGQDLDTYEFYNENGISSVCTKYNFELYIKVIVDFEINCDNVDSGNTAYNSNSKTRIMPYCACLPLKYFAVPD